MRFVCGSSRVDRRLGGNPPPAGPASPASSPRAGVRCRAPLARFCVHFVCGGSRGYSPARL